MEDMKTWITDLVQERKMLLPEKVVQGEEGADSEQDRQALQMVIREEGTAAMTDPSSLSSFIQYCDKNYPANRKKYVCFGVRF